MKEKNINVVVVKAADSDQQGHRNYGYALKWIGNPIPAWIMDGQRCFGWFLRKSSAQSRADAYNERSAK